MIFFVADFFAEHVMGGAELTTDALTSSSHFFCNKVNSSSPRLLSLMKQNKSDFWVFGNFDRVPESTLLFAAKNLDYSVLEYDYKYCKFRAPKRHLFEGNSCDCEDTRKGKIVSIFLNNAKKTWWMSNQQLEHYKSKFPFLDNGKEEVLSSVFSDAELDFMCSLDTSKKDNKYVILNSKNWIKGVDDAKEYAEKNNLEYELVSGLKHDQFLIKLSKSKGMIFLPKSGDTCPRMVIEAKLLDCDLILNDNVQHKDEPWFQTKDTILKYLRKRTERFWCETENIAIKNLISPDVTLSGVDYNYQQQIDYIKEHKISFANQVYNEPEGIKNYLNSCLQFAEVVDEVYVINHRSSDKTLEIIESFKEKYDEAGIELNWKTEQRDFSKDFTIADLFGDAVKESKNELVFRHDADFIFSKGYIKTMFFSLKGLENPSAYACGYEIPVVSDKIVFKDGQITEHGPCKMHVPVPRVFKRAKTKCLQNHVNGKYEWFHPTDSECSNWFIIPFSKNSILSVNIKDEERMLMRETMNTFMEDLQKGQVEGNWLDNKDLRQEKEAQNDTESKLRSISIMGEYYEF